MKLKDRSRLVSKFHKYLHMFHMKRFVAYQPVLIGEKYVQGARDCFDRWEQIAKSLKKENCKSLVDLRCAEGFYVINAAKMDILSLGVDGDWRRLFAATNQIFLENISNASFMRAEINLEMIKNMESFDAVIFLSVLHHFMYKHDVKYCIDFMKALRTRINKVLFFEMGQSNEVSNVWAKQLPDMGSDPENWIRSLLYDAGFSKADAISYTASNLKDVNRVLFKVYK